jgi:hypothetical protein
MRLLHSILTRVHGRTAPRQLRVRLECERLEDRLAPAGLGTPLVSYADPNAIANVSF